MQKFDFCDPFGIFLQKPPKTIKNMIEELRMPPYPSTNTVKEETKATDILQVSKPVIVWYWNHELIFESNNPVLISSPPDNKESHMLIRI